METERLAPLVFNINYGGFTCSINVTEDNTLRDVKITMDGLVDASSSVSAEAAALLQEEAVIDLVPAEQLEGAHLYVVLFACYVLSGRRGVVKWSQDGGRNDKGSHAPGE